MNVKDKKYYGGFFEIDRRVGLREDYPLATRLEDVTAFLRKTGDSDRELMLGYFNEIINIATTKQTEIDRGIYATEERSSSDAYVVLCGFYWQVLQMIQKLQELGQLQVMKALPTENPLDSDSAAKAAFEAHLLEAAKNAPAVCDLPEDFHSKALELEAKLRLQKQMKA